MWVEGLLPRQLQEIEMNSTDETELARQIFIKLFARELEEKPNEIYCTEVDGKELLNQSWIRGIRCKYLFYIQLHIVHRVVGNSLPCCSDVYLHGFPTDCVHLCKIPLQVMQQQLKCISFIPLQFTSDTGTINQLQCSTKRKKPHGELFWES